jgi:hypothetical protein
MRSLYSFIIALLPAAVVVTGGVFLYSLAPTTPMLIILLLASFASVLLGITIYFRQNESMRHGVIELTWTHLVPESDCLPVFPSEFVGKMAPVSGNLWVADSLIEENLLLAQSNFDKLKNLFIINYNHGYRIEVKKCSVIHIGDYQLGFRDFDQCEVFKNAKRIAVVRDFGNYWTVEMNAIETTLKKVHAPIILFSWENEN